MIKISTFDELIEVLQSDLLTDEQLLEVIHKALKVYIDKEPRNVIIARLMEYWEEYGHLREKPLFLEDTE